MKTLFKQFILPVICGTIVALLLLIPIQSFTPVHAQEHEFESWAVIVGVSDYQNFDALPDADNDAEALSELLSPIWGADHIKLLTNSEATKDGISDAITNWLAPQEEAEDVVLFFWSGWILPGYLMPNDSLTESYDNDISASELNILLGDLDSEKIVVMNTPSDGFIDMLSGEGRIILASDSTGEDSWYVEELGHSVFTYFILEAIREFEDADSDNNFELSVEEVFNYAQPRTTDYTASDPDLTTQRPQMSGSDSGELNLLMKFTFSTESNLPSGTTILTLDGEGYSSAPPTLTWAPGSAHSLEVPSLVDAGSGTRYAFTSWGDGDTSASRTITQGGAYTASYRIQYLLAVESAYSEPTGAGWYDAGSTAPIQVASIEEATTKYIFTGWSGDYSGTTASASVVMDGPKTVATNWRTEYLLTIESAYGEPTGAGWYDAGSTAPIQVASIEEATTKYIFTEWSGDYSGTTASASVVMDGPKTVATNWRTEYLLAVESAYGEPTGAGWYDAGSTVTISVTSPEGAIIRQIFTGWSGDFSGNTATASITVNSAMAITANWRTDSLQLFLIIGVVVIIVVAGVLLTIWMRRKKTLAPATEKETAPLPTTPRRCASCNGEIEPGDTFCIKCGKPV